eukprot:jgi/Bigna1/52972/estExt_Genewise1Plus.C_140011
MEGRGRGRGRGGGDRGGFGGGFGDGGRGRGRGRGGGRGRGRGGRGGRGGRRGRGRRGRRKDDKDVWHPVTKLGRLVKAKKILKLEDIFLFSLPIKEPQIVDYFLGDKLEDEVMKVMPVQKQTTAGQRTRFKAFVAVGDRDGHVGLGVKCSAEVANAIRGAIDRAKLNIIPIRRGYWGGTFGKPHTIPTKVTGKCGSVTMRLIPAPRGTGVVAGRVPKKFLEYAGVKDIYTSATGATRTLGNFIKATYQALSKTYSFLTPDMWEVKPFTSSPYQEHTDFLKENGDKNKKIQG